MDMLPLIATIAGSFLTGGVALWLLNKFWLTKKEETDVAKELRDEMRKYLADYDARLTKLQNELDASRVRFFTLLEEHTALKLENMRLRAELDLINPKPVFYRERPQATTISPVLYRDLPEVTPNPES